MAFGNFNLTDFGISQLVKSHKGKGIHFSRYALGDGDIGTSSVLEVKQLKSERLSLLIDAVSISTTEALITVTLSNALVETGFYLKEMAIMATDPDTGEEGAYAYNRDSSAGEYIPDKNSNSTLREYLRVHCNVEGAQNVTFQASGNPLYVTPEELTTEVNSQINAKAGIAGGLALYDTLKAFIDSKGQAGGLALFDTLKAFMDTKGQPGGLATYDSTIQAATFGGTAVPKSGNTLQFPMPTAAQVEARPSAWMPTKADVGLGNVDNTSDSAKSVKYASTAGSAPANGGNAATLGGKTESQLSVSYATTAGSAPAAGGWANTANYPTRAVGLADFGLRGNFISNVAPSGGSDGDTWDQY